MIKDDYGRGYDLDYYDLYLRRHLRAHHFAEADDDVFIAARADAAADVFVAARLDGDDYFTASEKAIETLCRGLEISPYDLISDILVSEFFEHISLDDRSIEFWTYTLLNELAPELKDTELSDEFLDTTEGVVFKLTVTGRIALFFEENGL